MALDNYLRELRSDGAADGRGAFTLAPDKARRKLAASVPPVFASPWAAVAFLRLALRLWHDSHLEPERVPPDLTGDYQRDSLGLARKIFGSVDQCTLLLTGRAGMADSLLPLKRLREILEESSSRLFLSTDPIAICCSRAFVILAGHDLGATFRFGDGVPDLSVGGGEATPPPDELVAAAGEPGAGEVRVVFSVTKAWFAPPNSAFSAATVPNDGYHYLISDAVESYSLGRCVEAFRRRAHARVMSAFGIPLGVDSLWERCASRDNSRLCFDFPDTANWFDYRCKKVILLEYLVPCEGASPLMVSRDSAPTDQKQRVQRPGEAQTSWQRVTTDCENLLLRHWSSVPEPGQNAQIACRAILSVVLSDAPSRVILQNWSNTSEITPLPDLPPGLAASVWWPELRQSLYGETWVRDDAYQQALEWTKEHATAAFLLLRQEFEYVWKMLVRDHVRRSCRAEVSARLENWLRP